MAELSGSPADGDCCSAERQQGCCEPSAKAECCGRSAGSGAAGAPGHEDGCGCAVADEPAYAGDAALGSSSSTAFSSSTD